MEMAARWPARRGASEEQIAALEERLGRRLPPSYRAFLAETDGVDADLDRALPRDWFDSEAYEGFLATDEADVVGIANPLVLLEGLPAARELSALPDGPLATWRLRAARTRSRPLLTHLAHCVVACASRTRSVYLDPLTVDADGEWEAWVWDGMRFIRHRSFAELVENALSRPPPFAAVDRPEDPDRRRIWDLARRAEHGPADEARRALDLLRRAVDVQSGASRRWVLDELGRSQCPEVGRSFAYLLARRVEDIQVAGSDQRPGAWLREPGARDLVAEILIHHPTLASGFGALSPDALADAYIRSGNTWLLDWLVYHHLPGGAAEAARRLESATIDAAARARLEGAVAHAAQYEPERNLSRWIRDAAHGTAAAPVGWVPPDARRAQALDLLEGVFALRPYSPGHRARLSATSEVLDAAADLVAAALRQERKPDLVRLSGVLGDIATVAGISADDDQLGPEVVLSLELAGVRPARREAATDVLATLAADGDQRAGDALARLGDVRSLDIEGTPVDVARRAAYVDGPAALAVLRRLVADPATDNDTAVTAACGLLRRAYTTASPAFVVEARGALVSRKEADVKKLCAHWDRTAG